MKKYFFAIATLLLPASLMAQQFIPAPPTPPTRGVIAPLIQLPPNAAMDMFVADLREALQGGSVPDISLFHQLAAVYDQRHYDFYPEVLSIAATVYRDMVNRYLSLSREAHRMSDNHIVPMDDLARNTHRQAMMMVESARNTAAVKNQAAKVRLANAIKFLRDQVAQYKGNPATLSMPLSIIPRSLPGDVAGLTDGNRSRADVEVMAIEQLRAAQDRLGSGSPRSNQWLQLIREYSQAIVTRDAVFKSFNAPNDHSLDSIAR